jgi:dinuclear metal center YbgI/SA1388 family protein
MMRAKPVAECRGSLGGQQSWMQISDLIQAMESIAPTRMAEEWDNVGLIVGSDSWPLEGPVLLTIDLTERVVDEAVRRKCAAVVAYHPPLFQSVKRVVDGPGSSASQRVALRMARAGIAVYSPHTALDAATGGVTDWLADGLIAGAVGGGADRRAIRPLVVRDGNQELKIVTFVPESAVETMRGALATAGAGMIGNYTRCSFATPGTGTFHGDEESNPAVGRAGAFESTPEIRLEMVCSRRSLAIAITTLKQFHPYEEPAIDVYPLEGKPDRMVGVGRRLMLDHPVAIGELAQRLKRHLGVGTVQVGAAGGDLTAMVSCIGLVPGAGESVAGAAKADGCEVFVTGEMRHHEVNAAVASGLSVILGGHTATERGYLPTLAGRLKEQLGGAECVVSEEDRDPLVVR